MEKAIKYSSCHLENEQYGDLPTFEAITVEKPGPENYKEEQGYVSGEDEPIQNSGQK